MAILSGHGPGPPSVGIDAIGPILPGLATITGNWVVPVAIVGWLLVDEYWCVVCLGSYLVCTCSGFVWMLRISALVEDEAEGRFGMRAEGVPGGLESESWVELGDSNAIWTIYLLWASIRRRDAEVRLGTHAQGQKRIKRRIPS